MIILAIETSCDETAVSIAEFKNQKVKVLAETVSSQVELHARYGGVVPMLAAREHLKNFMPVLKRTLKRAFKKDVPECRRQIDYIAVTNGPGLIPALMIGVSAAKALAYAWQKPLIPVHHIEGHIYANWLRSVDKIHNSRLWKPEFPVLCLVVSGGHTQLVLMKKDLDYKIIGRTRDDAAGEAFDKVAKLLGLGYPGGPIIEKLAKQGDTDKIKLPRPMIKSGDFDFSFSGLKTAVLVESRKVESRKSLRTKKYPKSYKMSNSFKYNLAASFQQAVIDVLISKTIAAAKKYKAKNILLGGGVAANKELQRQFRKAINKEIHNTQYIIPNTKLTTDNATMIAVAAYYHIINKKNIKDWKSVKTDAGLKLK